MADEKPAEKRATVEHKLDKLGVRFTLHERPTVRQQLKYWSRVRESWEREDLFERYWEGAKALIVEWACDYMPLDVDLDTVDDPRIVDVIQAAAMLVLTHVRNIEETPKN